MKAISHYMILLVFVLPINCLAQGYLKSDYILSSSLKDDAGNKVGSGDLFKISGRYTLPLSVKRNNSGQVSTWSATLSGSYGMLNNKNMSVDINPDKIVNANLNISHIRPLSEKWYLLASLGGGLFSEPNKITGKSLLINGGGIFVYRVNDNLDIGIGAGVTNAYGAPIIMPMSYLKMQFVGKYEFKVDMASNAEISASIQFRENFKLRLVALEVDGLSAVMKRNDKSMIYASTVLRSYLTPELKIGKLSTLYLGVGGAWIRSAKLTDRTYKSFIDYFKKDDNDYRFASTGYLTVGFKYGF